MGLSLRGLAAGIGRSLYKPLAGRSTPKNVDRDARAETGAAAGLFGSAALFAGKSPVDRLLDGHFVGAGGRTFPPGTPPGAVSPVTPANGPRNARLLIFIGGRETDRLAVLAERTGSRVIGIFVAAGVVTSPGERLDIGRNPAVDTLADTVYEKLRAGRDVYLTTGSTGAVIAGRALEDVKNRLMLEDEMTRAAAETLMRPIRIEPLGGRRPALFANRRGRAVIRGFRAGRTFVSRGGGQFSRPAGGFLRRAPFRLRGIVG